jgi:hypothetical protein
VTSVVRGVYNTLIGTEVKVDKNDHFWYMWANREEQLTTWFPEDVFIMKYYIGADNEPK